MKRQPPCTMRDLAAHLGVSIATVSRALRSDSRITESVRLKVVKAANSLGYRRDPKLAQLMSHVRSTKERTFQGTLAWITDHDIQIPAEAKAHTLYWEPASQRAEELGYKLECFPNCTAADAARIDRRLRAQGIRGVVIQQFKEAFNLPDWHLNWKRYAVVHNGSCQIVHALDSVDADDIGNCISVFQHLVSRGYHRIGICTTLQIERALNYALSTAQYRFHLLHPGTAEIPPCLLPDLGTTSAKRTARWLKRHRVDAVVSQVRGMKELLIEAGRKVPDEIGLAWQGVNPHNPNSGMWQREDIIATVTVETVIASVEQGRLGLPPTPRLTQIAGDWHQGTTCRE